MNNDFFASCSIVPVLAYVTQNDEETSEENQHICIMKTSGMGFDNGIKQDGKKEKTQ